MDDVNDWYQRYKDALTQPPEAAIKQVRRAIEASEKKHRESQYEQLAILGGVAHSLSKKPEELKRLEKARVFKTRGDVTIYTLVFEAAFDASDPNGRRRAETWARVAEYLIENKDIRPKSIPKKLADEGGIAKVLAQARTTAPKSNAAAKVKEGKESTARLLKPVKGSEEAEVSIRLGPLAKKLIEALKDGGTLHVTVQKVAGGSYLYLKPARRPTSRAHLSQGRILYPPTHPYSWYNSL